MVGQTDTAYVYASDGPNNETDAVGDMPSPCGDILTNVRAPENLDAISLQCSTRGFQGNELAALVRQIAAEVPVYNLNQQLEYIAAEYRSNPYFAALAGSNFAHGDPTIESPH
jgi:hypothetical protein